MRENLEDSCTYQATLNLSSTMSSKDVETLLHLACRIVLSQKHLLQFISCLPKDINYMLLNAVLLTDSFESAFKLLIQNWPYPVLVISIMDRFLDILLLLIKEQNFGSIRTIDFTNFSPFSGMVNKQVPCYINEPGHIAKLMSMSKYGGNVLSFLDLEVANKHECSKRNYPLSIEFDLSLEWSMSLSDMVDWIILYFRQQKMVLDACATEVPLNVLLHVRSLRMIRFEHSVVLSVLQSLDPQYLKCFECYNSSFHVRDDIVVDVFHQVSLFVYLDFLCMPYIPSSFKNAAELVKCLRPLGCLRGFQITDSEMDSNVLQQIFCAGIKSSQLETLKLVRVKLDRSALAALSKNPSFSRLTVLSLHSLKDLPKYVNELYHFLRKQESTLVELHLMYCGFTNQQLKLLCPSICSLKAIRILRIDETGNLFMGFELKPELMLKLSAGVRVFLNDVLLDCLDV